MVEVLSSWILGDSAAMKILSYAIAVIVPYLLGGINFAVIFSRNLYKEDIRDSGSGNAGTTNMLRTYGKKAAILTLICDALKSMISVTLGLFIVAYEGGAWIAAVMCMLGHIFPVWHKFKGGKGVAVAAFAIAVLNPLVFIIIVAVFAIIVIWTKYVSLGSMIGALVMPLLNNRITWMFKSDLTETVCSVLIVVIIIVTHIPNIKRLRDGTESKIKVGSGRPLQ